jgi:hypothetical protein
MTKEDEVVIANVLLFRVYGAIKIWHEYSNLFEPTPPPRARKEDGSCYTIFGLAVFSVEQMDHLAQFFLTLRHPDQRDDLACLITQQHQVPNFVYAMDKGTLLIILDIISTYPSLIKKTATNPNVTLPHQLAATIQSHLDTHYCMYSVLLVAMCSCGRQFLKPLFLHFQTIGNLPCFHIWSSHR